MTYASGREWCSERKRCVHALITSYLCVHPGSAKWRVGGGSEAVRRRSSIAPTRSTSSGSSRKGSVAKDDTIEAITEHYRRNPAVVGVRWCRCARWQRVHLQNQAVVQKIYMALVRERKSYSE